MKKFVAIELEISDGYKDKEDIFMNNFMKQLKHDETLVILPYNPDTPIQLQRYVKNYITGRYEFIDIIKGF